MRSRTRLSKKPTLPPRRTRQPPRIRRPAPSRLSCSASAFNRSDVGRMTAQLVLGKPSLLALHSRTLARRPGHLELSPGAGSCQASSTREKDVGIEDSVETENADVDELLRRLVRFLLRNSAEGAFELQPVIRAVGKTYGVRADVLIIVEGAVVTVSHADGSQYTAIVRVAPELARLDLVSESKLLVNRITAGELQHAQRARSCLTCRHAGIPTPLGCGALAWRSSRPGLRPACRPPGES